MGRRKLMRGQGSQDGMSSGRGGSLDSGPQFVGIMPVVAPTKHVAVEAVPGTVRCVRWSGAEGMARGAKPDQRFACGKVLADCVQHRHGWSASADTDDEEVGLGQR